jgi:hypothetical protein
MIALTLPQTIALALVGTPDPVCIDCGAPAFVSCGGQLYCKSAWQQGACETPCKACEQPGHSTQRCPEIRALLLREGE